MVRKGRGYGQERGWETTGDSFWLYHNGIWDQARTGNLYNPPPTPRRRRRSELGGKTGVSRFLYPIPSLRMGCGPKLLNCLKKSRAFFSPSPSLDVTSNAKWLGCGRRMIIIPRVMSLCNQRYKNRICFIFNRLFGPVHQKGLSTKRSRH